MESETLFRVYKEDEPHSCKIHDYCQFCKKYFGLELNGLKHTPFGLFCEAGACEQRMCENKDYLIWKEEQRRESVKSKILVIVGWLGIDNLKEGKKDYICNTHTEYKKVEELLNQL